MTKRESDPDPASSAGRLLRALGISAAKSTTSNSSCRRPGPDAGPASSSNDDDDHNEIELDDFACRRRHRASADIDNETRLPAGSPYTRIPHRRTSSVTSLASAASTSSTTSTSSTSSIWSLFAPFSQGHTHPTDVARPKISRDIRRQDAAEQVWRDYW